MLPGILAQDAVNHIWVQVPACVLPFPGSLALAGTAGLRGHPRARFLQVISDALRCLRMNRQTPLLAALAHDFERVVPAIHVEVSDLEAAISARRNPTCNPTDKIARSRSPKTSLDAARPKSCAPAFAKTLASSLPGDSRPAAPHRAPGFAPPPRTLRGVQRDSRARQVAGARSWPPSPLLPASPAPRP